MGFGWCERCDAEREGDVCPVCGGVLLPEITEEDLETLHSDWEQEEGCLLDQWPVGADGQPEEPEPVPVALSFWQGREVLQRKLEQAGISARYRHLDQEDGISGYDFCIYVPRSRAEEAGEIVGGLSASGRRY